jgi:dihydroceramidase
MTGMGAYCYILWGIWLRHCLNGRQDEFEFIWPHLYCLPMLVRAEAMEHSNGSMENAPLKKSE